MRMLLLTSMFASALAFHNTIARYLFALGQVRLLPAALARVHAVHGSPAVAGRLQTATAVTAIIAFALSGSSPHDVVFNYMSALSTIGILSLQVLVSLAVIVFFRRFRTGRRVWTTVVAPVLGMAGPSYTLVLVVQNLPILSGADTLAVWSLPFLAALTFAAGVASSFGQAARAARPLPQSTSTL